MQRLLTRLAPLNRPVAVRSVFIAAVAGTGAFAPREELQLNARKRGAIRMRAKTGGSPALPLLSTESAQQPHSPLQRLTRPSLRNSRQMAI